jgi:hypothetical protein
VKNGDYTKFLLSKSLGDPNTGLSNPPSLPKALFEFQNAITRWALRRGRAAIFAGTGLGKTIMALVWAHSIHKVKKCKVLIFTPLAVAHQFVEEGQKFDIVVKQCRSQKDVIDGINITNYEKMVHFDLSQFGAVVLDESSILKSFDGKTRTMLIELCRQIPFRLAATATPAPNDYMELGNHAEFLGIMSCTDMLSTFFTHDGGDTSKWRLKGHSEDAFWQWMCSWSIMFQHPKDLGYDENSFDLPPLNQIDHVIETKAGTEFLPGSFLPFVARDLQERIRARRDTVADRVKRAVELTPRDRPFVWWCNLNSESTALTKSITDAVEVYGSENEERKERKLIDFAKGRIRVLVTKPGICGHGLNWQHCADTGFVGLNDSFEQVYQAIRRFWRFGQTKKVNVHFITADVEQAVMENLGRKHANAENMRFNMIRRQSILSRAVIRGAVRDVPVYHPQEIMELPSWISK